jgi:ATP-binding cassette subfamily B (MDR/TAP) protein 1
LQGEAEEAKKAEKTLAVPYYKLFKYADRLDVLLVIGGTIAAIVEGATLPIFFVSAASLLFVHLLHAVW